MGLFDTLLNLDVELSCLATKAFVAKEEFVDKVCYPVKSKNDKSEEKTEDVKSGVETTDEKTEVTVNDSYNELKALMDEAMEVVGDTQLIKQLDAGIKQSIEDLKLYIERAKQEKEKQQKLQVDPNAVNPYLQVQAQTQEQQLPIMAYPHPQQAPGTIVGMDFSPLYAGVQYDPHVQQGTGLKPVTQADLDEAFARAAQEQQAQAQQAQQTQTPPAQQTQSNPRAATPKGNNKK